MKNHVFVLKIGWIEFSGFNLKDQPGPVKMKNSGILPADNRYGVSPPIEKKWVPHARKRMFKPVRIESPVPAT
jgi:hypothetical protein